MSAIVINHGETKFELRFKKAAVWFSRIELSIYSILLVLTFGALYIYGESERKVKIAVIAIFAAAFIVVFIMKINSWKNYTFILEKKSNLFVINEKVKIESILASNIFLKEMVSESGSSYFDIFLRLDGKKFRIIEGVIEEDKEIIMKELREFLSNSS